MLRQLVGDLFGGPSLTREMPYASLKSLATLALRRTIADQFLVIDRRLATDIVEVEAAVRLLPIEARVHRINEGIERRQLAAVADLKTADCDVTCGVAVKLNPGAGLAVKRELA